MADKKIRLLVKAEVSKAVRNLNKLEKETKETKKSASELTSTFKTMFGAAVLGAGIKSIIDTASTFESLRTRLVALKGSTEEGAYFFSCVDGGGSATAKVQWNFGNPPYANSSSVSDANGYGDFEYTVPSGYLALCTKNLGSDGG